MFQASAPGSFGLCSFIFYFSEVELPLKAIPSRSTWLTWMALLNTGGKDSRSNLMAATSFSASSISIHNWDSLAFQSPCRNIWALHEERIPYALLLVKSVYPRSWPRINKTALWFPWVYTICFNYWCIILGADATFPHIKGKKISEQ